MTDPLEVRDQLLKHVFELGLEVLANEVEIPLHQCYLRFPLERGPLPRLPFFDPVL